MNGFQDAFISYGRADSKAFAIKLYDRLTEQGLKVWFDAEDIPLGVDYQNQIDRDIELTHNFLFIISPMRSTLTIAVGKLNRRSTGLFDSKRDVGIVVRTSLIRLLKGQNYL